MAIDCASGESAGCALAVGNSAAGGFLATALQSFLAPSATFGALLMTSRQGTIFSTVSQPIAIYKSFLNVESPNVRSHRRARTDAPKSATLDARSGSLWNR